jgi:uncharacterized protein YegP (UPF0339 family)
MKPIEYWKNSKGEFNYHIIGQNGRILAEIKQGFTRKANMIKNIRIYTENSYNLLKEVPAPEKRLAPRKHRK